jgi:hypothetical protein
MRSLEVRSTEVFLANHSSRMNALGSNLSVADARLGFVRKGDSACRGRALYESGLECF